MNTFAQRDGASGRHLQSVDRAFAVLELLADRGPAGVTEVASELGLHKSTAFRLLATLERRAIVEQDGRTGKYGLGQGIVQLSRAVTPDLDLRRRARPVCERLAERVQETVNIAVLERDEVANVDQMIGSANAVNVNWLGQRTPLHCTSSGKVFLAQMPESRRRRILGRRVERFTPGTIVDPAVYEEQFRAIHAEGFAYTIEELEVGLNAVAAPIRSRDGTVIAAVSVAGPSFRITPELIPELGAATKAAADEVSRSMGFREGRPLEPPSTTAA